MTDKGQKKECCGNSKDDKGNKSGDFHDKDDNNNNNKKWVKGYSYSCSGVLYYTSEMAKNGNHPICFGISGKWKPGNIPRQDIERLEVDKKKMQQRSSNGGESSSPSQDFTYGCVGYSRVILKSLEEAEKNSNRNVKNNVTLQHYPKSKQRQSTDEEQLFGRNWAKSSPSAVVVGMPHCMSGANIIDTSLSVRDTKVERKESPPPQRRPSSVKPTVDDLLQNFDKSIRRKRNGQDESNAVNSAKTENHKDKLSSSETPSKMDPSEEDESAQSQRRNIFKGLFKGMQIGNHKNNLKEDMEKKAEANPHSAQLDSENSLDDNDEEQLERDVEMLRERFRKAMELNESDPNTWKRREWSQQHRKIMEEAFEQQRLEQQQRLQALRREREQLELQKRQQKEKDGLVLPFGLNGKKLYDYMVKTAYKTKDKMYNNAILVSKELTRSDLPSRVYMSSQRMVQQFSPTLNLFKVSLLRCRDNIVKAFDSWSGGGDGNNKRH